MLVSVIVPVYKAEQWLHRCVDSILAQTMTDFELLLINDGSPDKSGEICDEYAAKDSRVRVFHKDNGGVSSARNLGLDNAKGEWISFVDADDWVEIDYLAGLTENLDADIIAGGMRNTQGNVCVAGNRLYYKFDIKDFIEEHNVNHFIRSVCSKIYRRGIIEKNDIRFNEKIRFGEDTIFNKQVLLCVNIVRRINSQAYIYYIPLDVSGNLKYNLKLDEIDFSVKIFCALNKKLNAKFSSNNLWQDVHWLLIMYNLDEILQYGDEKLYHLYKYRYPNRNYYSFCGDINYSPIIRSIFVLIEKYKQKDFIKCRCIYSNVVEFCKSKPWYIKFDYKKFYFWYLLLKINMWFIFDLFMKLYCRFQNNRRYV